MALTEKQLQAIAFIKIRPDATREEIAEKVGVSGNTIGRWKKLPEWREGLLMVPEDILKDTMFLKAANGDTQAFDKWMRFFGTEKKPESDDFARSLDLTEDVLERIARDAYEYVRAQHAA